MSLICYETYDFPRAKRAAQKGAKRGKPTGKANDYQLVDTTDRTTRGHGAIAPVYHQEPGEDCHGLAYTSVGWEYLATRCRRIGRCHLPTNWAKAFRRYLTN